MTIEAAYDQLCREYLSKCQTYGCDSCIASIYCTLNNLRTSRYPQDYCVENLKLYFKDKEV